MATPEMVEEVGRAHEATGTEVAGEWAFPRMRHHVVLDLGRRVELLLVLRADRVEAV